MGSIGANKGTGLPKYSNEEGVITDKTIEAQPRYEQITQAMPELPAYKIRDMLGKVMKMEEQGETEGSIFIYEFERPDNIPFGKYLTAYTKALKSAGYKVTSRENKDRHDKGYATVRGGRVYASTTKARKLNIQKI